MLRFAATLSILVGCTGSPEPAPPEAPAAQTPATTAPSTTAKGVKQHSVILISLDTVRADRMEVYGGRAKTPNLMAMAREGVRVERAITNMTETALSHWAMITGVLPEVHGNVPAAGGSRFTGPTLTERLKRSGYATGAFIGGETLTNRSTGFSRGFDVFDDQYNWDRADLRRPGPEVTARAAQWISQQQGPYFAFVHYFDAHFPYTPSPPFDRAYDPNYAGTITGSDADLRPYRDGEKEPSKEDLAHVLALYDGEISELDQTIKPLLDIAGPDTIVIVTSDHGESFEHGYYFNHRDGLWDSVVRIPLLMKGPGMSKGHVVKEQFELIDIAPTVLDLLGLDPLEQVHGISRAEAARGQIVEERPGYTITDPWRTEARLAISDSKRKIITSRKSGQMFRLHKDPDELQPTEFRGVKMAWIGYSARLRDVKKKWQGPELPPRQPPPDEQERLKALGYVGPGGDPAADPTPR